MKIDLNKLDNKTRYNLYLASDQWKKKSDKCKKLANNKCSICGSDKSLQAHHINQGEENSNDRKSNILDGRWS